MTPSSTAAKVVFGVAGLLLIGFDAPAALREPADGFVPAPQAIARIVYVSATDKYGNPVTDLQQADFELKVDGKKSTIVNVRPAAGAHAHCAHRLRCRYRRLPARTGDLHATAAWDAPSFR